MTERTTVSIQFTPNATEQDIDKHVEVQFGHLNPRLIKVFNIYKHSSPKLAERIAVVEIDKK